MGSESPKEAPPTGSEANSEGLTPRREQKPVEARECAFATALAPFLLRVASSGVFGVKRGEARRAETAKIYHSKLVPASSSPSVGELHSRLVFVFVV